MTKREKEYWENFKQKYGENFKRVATMTSSGVYVEVEPSNIAAFSNVGRSFLVGEIAEYIYDLEEIKEESIVMFKKYNSLLKKYNKLKELKGE